MDNSINQFQSVRDYLTRIPSDFAFKNFKKAVLTEQVGRYISDVATITFSRDKAPEVWAKDKQTEQYEATPAEVTAILADLATYDWPQPALIKSLTDPAMPDFWRNAAEEDRHVINDVYGKPILLQVRINPPDADKYYQFVTAWTDRNGYRLESWWPEKLPLFNLELIRRLKVSTIFIHEGPKSAARAQRIADGLEPGHPWEADLVNAVHIAFLGGVYNVDNADWGQLDQFDIKQIYVVPDNDEPGKMAKRKLCKILRKGQVFSFEVGGSFPTGWDFGDDLPRTLFNKNGLYIGRTFGEHILPVTYATVQIGEAKGKPIYGLSRDFAAQWFFVNDEDLYIHQRFSSLKKTETGFNNYLAPYSDVKEISERLKKDASRHVDAIVYRPGEPKAVFQENNKRLFNVYEKSSVRPIDGDATPFYDFVAYLLEDETERKEFLRWFFTMVGSPKTRMHYSCLMYSAEGGTGKSTVAEMLYALVGANNASIAHPGSLESQFNSHFDGIRLLIMNELYTSDAKVTDALKTTLTDTHIRINAKYKSEKTVENTVHIFAGSNSEQALRLPDKDRRWFVTSTTETPWPKEKFDKFRDWLFAGIGLNIVMAEAEKFGNYVTAGERAPQTRSKREVIKHSITRSERALAELNDDFAAVPEEPATEDYPGSKAEPAKMVAVEAKNMQAYLTGNATNPPPTESFQKNTNRLKATEWAYLSESDDEFGGYRPKINDKRMTVFVNGALKEEMKRKGKPAWAGLIRDHLMVLTPHSRTM